MGRGRIVWTVSCNLNRGQSSCLASHRDPASLSIRGHVTESSDPERCVTEVPASKAGRLGELGLLNATEPQQGPTVDKLHSVKRDSDTGCIKSSYCLSRILNSFLRSPYHPCNQNTSAWRIFPLHSAEWYHISNLLLVLVAHGSLRIGLVETRGYR